MRIASARAATRGDTRTVNPVRTRPTALELAIATSLAAGAALLATVALRFGAIALALPVVAVAMLVLLRRPGLAVALLVGVVVLGERADTGLLAFTSTLYDPLPIGATPSECLLALAVLAVVLDRLAARAPLRLGGPLALPLALVALAALAGAVTGWSHGA